MKLVTAVLVCIGMGGCSDPKEGIGTQSTDESMHAMTIKESKYEVTYQPDTVVVAQEAMQFLSTPIRGKNELVFAAAAKLHLNLEKGKVTIFPMAALVRVQSWQEVGGNIVVQTAPAVLTDAIKEADIRSLTEISWNELLAQADEQERAFTFHLFPEAVAEEELGHAYASFSRTFGPFKGLSVTFTLKPEAGNKLAYEITAKASKKAHKNPINRSQFAERYGTSYLNANEFQPVSSEYVDNTRGFSGEEEPVDYTSSESLRSSRDSSVGLEGGTKGFLKASGSISGFQSRFNLQIRSASVNSVDFDFSSVQGDMKLESASLSGLASTFHLKIPIEYSITVPLGGVIPLTFTLGAELSFRPIVDVGTAGSAKLCFYARYDGSTGLQYSNGIFSNQSQVSERTTENCPDTDTVSAGRVTVGMGSTVTFPAETVSSR